MSSLDLRAIDGKELPERPAPKVRQELRVFISEDAFDRAVARGSAELSREIGGVLVGEVLRDEAGPYLHVDATIDALHAEEKGAELTFTHATWEHIHKTMDSEQSGKKLVGWYHTHPGFGIFLSDRDQFIHRSFFNLPFQVALVYDPRSREHGVFGWRDNEVWRIRRYFIGGHEHVWDGARVAAPQKADIDKMDKKDVVSEGSSPDGGNLKDDWWGMALAGVVVLLLGGVAGYFLGNRGGGEVAALSRAQVAELQSKSARETVAALNSELLAAMRVLTSEVDPKAAEEAARKLDEALAGLDASPASVKAKEAGAAVLRQARDGIAARRTIAALERLSAQLDARVDPRDVMAQRRALGNLYAELARDVAKTGDAKRAHRLLVNAAALDPGGQARYEQQLKELDPNAKLEPPAPAQSGTLPSAVDGGAPAP
jgi:proteasome lid subunit RPN8/RPN11